jgi:hypothetical protein
MKVFPEIDDCYNCNVSFEVPKDSEGLLRMDEGSHLCDRCRINPNISRTDYMHLLKCKNEGCNNTYWTAKKYTNSIECFSCCCKRYGKDNK